MKPTNRSKLAKATRVDAYSAPSHVTLIYQTWSIKDMKGNGQGFLAKLKSKGFEFFAMPSGVLDKNQTAAIPIQLPPPQDPAPLAAGP